MAPGAATADPPWRKSSRSMANGNCVETRITWRKAAASMSNGACVEVAEIDSPEKGAAL